MATRKISALPVTEGDRLVGIVTETDVLQLFVRAMGVL
jgi:CBS domain-containing protein